MVELLLRTVELPLTDELPNGRGPPSVRCLFSRSCSVLHSKSCRLQSSSFLWILLNFLLSSSKESSSRSDDDGCNDGNLNPGGIFVSFGACSSEAGYISIEGPITWWMTTNVEYTLMRRKFECTFILNAP